MARLAGPRPRWGTFSVRAHQNLSALTTDVLLFDALMLPTPDDHEEESRWADAGWEPDALHLRTIQLGDLVYPVPWTQQMREQWEDYYRWRRELQEDDPDLPFQSTADVMANAGWRSLVDAARDAGAGPTSIGDQVDVPELIASYQSADMARRSVWAREPGTWGDLPAPEGFSLGLELRLRLVSLEADSEEHAEDVWLGAIELAHDERFRRSRTALFEHEQRLSQYQRDDAALVLENLVRDYNRQVEKASEGRYVRAVARTVLRLLPLAASFAPVPGLGWAAGETKRIIEARFPDLGDAPNERQPHEGEFLQRSLSVLGHD